MELSGIDRILLLQALPQHGFIRDARVIRTLREKLGFEEDSDRFGLKESPQPDGRVSLTWDPRLIKETAEFEIGEREFDLVADVLKKLEAAGKLPVPAVGLWDKFVERKE